MRGFLNCKLLYIETDALVAWLGKMLVTYRKTRPRSLFVLWKDTRLKEGFEGIK